MDTDYIKQSTKTSFSADMLGVREKPYLTDGATLTCSKLFTEVKYFFYSVQ